ncbi:extracellular dipeptidyl-peptidase Dpp4 [Geopyxis carbonaria]|nr:extracellular dipeptidyl-peptidase Dpp4 [Geopyxis carbonaria]
MKLFTTLAPLALPLLAAAQNGTKLFTYKDAFSGAFAAQRTSLQWISADSDGTYVETDATSSLLFVNAVTGENSTFVDATKLGFEYYDYEIQPSRENVLFSANYTKQYRHSYFADYYVFNRESGKTTPLVEGQNGDVQYATWSTQGDVVAFVRGNDLYLWKAGAVTRVTTDGGVDVFNGVPDWVYEEEIYGDRYTLWFSPDGEYLAFLRFNETGVPTYTVPYYMAGQNVAPAYPKDLDIRYPKVSETNPTVSFHLLNVASGDLQTISHDTFPADDLIISEVAWVADTHERVLFRAMNRVQDLEKIVVVSVPAGTSAVVRERDGTDGWIDNNLAVQYVNGTDSYLDLSDHTGWTHIYLYPVSGGNPKALTSGKWEVASIVKVDAARNLVYYLSTERHSTERHLYSVHLKTGKKTALVDTKTAGYWSASFSALGSYYILSYNGPSLPHQALYSINSTTVPLQVLTSNTALATKLSAYALPRVNYITLRHPSGYTLNARETLPANFDARKRYPVLFDPYGGPGAQQVTKAWPTPAWRTYIASDPELQYIQLTVDNRGTGFRGRAFRALVTRRLGALEAADQIWAARTYATRRYVDPAHIALWGWSYGGYLTSKVLEAQGDASGPFSLGLITAPVTDWRFYDSMYTERYMKTLATNAAGYAASAVRNATGFKNVAGGFLVQHGTGDDNVHFQNSAALVDLLTREGVSPEKMEVRWFTDSDHGISFHGAGGFLYRQLTKRLWEERERRLDGKEVHQWSKRTARGHQWDE